MSDLALASPSRQLTCCGVYRRGDDGTWTYPWGGRVPGARDLTVGDAGHLGIDPWQLAERLRRQVDPAERAWAEGRGPHRPGWPLRHPTPATDGAGRSRVDPHGRDLVIGLLAPELQAHAMLLTGDLAARAGVERETIDSYRTRGKAPEPQVLHGRTPMWSAPVVDRWLADRRRRRPS